jgi:formylglycine-generating enzyme required for sulfatase activity
VAAAVTEGLGLGLLGPGRRVVIPPPALSVDRYASAAGTTRPAIHITPFIGTAVVQIPPARFEVPNPAGGAPRKVEVTRPFWIGMTEVTRGQFARLMGKPGGTVLAADADLPVVNITQAEAQEYCRRLGTHDRIRYRLPTEPEWELAARFGARALAAGGPPSYASVSGRRTVPVQSLIRSAIGLRGMAGDVAEWCDDGSGDLTGVIRGGPFAGPVALGTTGSMRTLPATERRPNVGFRVAADVISAPSRNDLPPQK